MFFAWIRLYLFVRIAIYLCVSWRIVSLCVLSGGDGACDEAAENLSLECGNSECSKMSSKLETLTSVR